MPPIFRLLYSVVILILGIVLLVFTGRAGIILIVGGLVGIVIGAKRL